MDRNSLRLVEGKMIRNSRNRRFRTCQVDPADHAAPISGQRFVTDFLIPVRSKVGTTHSANQQVLDGQSDSSSGAASL
ncbi:hypothetical protein [Blastopirellula marina]|uniref:Uncharacterized protein n=1 Tax=Blastopirellula marina TaxID=124 RepID=A0A2S8GAJ8_9BACT|nr:hypothetical protein [Blastopirellula marina]PQO26797.1 hypothetical protein C5Y98_28915 [Blastopirellula marina]PQO41485.1 hypothetical protein C5Y93_30715 [Blastopirellula marina]PTL41004.1 hypothetical protein C5Y97_28930 [Blastopirellula marina]